MNNLLGRLGYFTIGLFLAFLLTMAYTNKELDFVGKGMVRTARDFYFVGCLEATKTEPLPTKAMVDKCRVKSIQETNEFRMIWGVQ